MSHPSTPSFAPTYARPEPVLRLEVVERLSGVQTALEEAVQTVAKVLLASYFLYTLATPYRVVLKE